MRVGSFSCSTECTKRLHGSQAVLPPQSKPVGVPCWYQLLVSYGRGRLAAFGVQPALGLQRVAFGVEYLPALSPQRFGGPGGAHDGERRRRARTGQQVPLRGRAHLVGGARQQAVAEQLASVVRQARGEQRGAARGGRHRRIQRLEGAQVRLLQQGGRQVAGRGGPLGRGAKRGDRGDGVGVAVRGEPEGAAERGRRGASAVGATLLADLAVKERRAQGLAEQEQRRGVLVHVGHCGEG
mmetsp:Transcript_31073/g.79792  ORF Transcript_31073/g.79792 Transcript_31073/m.79792 type:complete len:239 (-) Transcript_31073:1336-2052(-)